MAAADDAGLTLGMAGIVPLGNGHVSAGVRLPGEAESDTRSVFAHSVSPGYFDVLRIPLREGRTFNRQDTSDVIVVNESLARLYWPGESAIGRQLFANRPRTIVGVVSDAHTEALDRFEPTFYEPTSTGHLVLTRDDSPTVQRFKALALQIEPGLQFHDEPLRENLRDRLRASTVGASLAATMGGLALLLAAVGTFGVFAYVVGERTREIGVRLALGGRAHQILGSLLRLMVWPLLGGATIGLAASAALGPVIGQSLYGVSPLDPMAYGVVTLLLAVVAIAAVILPAHRALRVDPAVTLRHD
jgi:hypothetical protein